MKKVIFNTTTNQFQSLARQNQQSKKKNRRHCQSFKEELDKDMKQRQE